nr:ATP-dependent acyl-CoA ligase [Burkholderiaceae bacterium]
VHECAVVGKRHPMLDEVPVLFVLPAAHSDIDLLERIQSACTAQLADFKRPHEMRIVKDFPRSTLEKIAKAQLRRMLDDEETQPS